MSSAVNEEYDDDLHTPPGSIYTTPVKGGNRGNVESPSPGFSGADNSFTTPSSGKLAFKTLTDVSDAKFFLKNAVTANAEIVAPPSPEKVSEYEDDEDEVDGKTKTFTELRSSYAADTDTVSDYAGNKCNIPSSTDARDDEIADSQASLEDNQTDNFKDHAQSWGSPVSSQGSMKSDDYLLKLTEDMENGATKVQNILQNLDNILPKEIYKLIEVYLSDKHGVDRLISFLRKDILCTAFYTGACQRNTGQSEVVERQLETHNENALLAVVGRVLVQRFGGLAGQPETQSGQSYTTAAQELEEMDMDVQSAAQYPVTGEPGDGRQLNNEVFQDDGNTQPPINTCRDVKVFSSVQPTSSSSLVPLHDNDKKHLPSVSDFRSHADVDALSTPKGRANSLIKRISVSEDTWENAYDQIKDNATNKNKQIEKSGEIFFNAVFTKEEIENCTFSGKKNTRKFDKCKVRFMRLAVAFIMTKPDKRTTKSFHKTTDQKNFVDLSNDDFFVLTKKVLQEYAYRERKKMKGK